MTGVKKLANGRFRARYFAGYSAAGKRVYPARTFDTHGAAVKWRSDAIANKITARNAAGSIARQYSQGAVYSSPFAIPSALKPIRKELLEIHLPLARISCVYFLLSDTDEILYVGQTTDFHARISAHARTGIPFKRAPFIPVQRPDLNATEAYFIKTINPPLNKSRGSIQEEVIESVRDLVAAHLCA